MTRSATAVSTADVYFGESSVGPSEADSLAYARLLGLKVKNKISLADRVEAGFSFHSFTRLQKLLDLPTQQLADLVQITSRTLTRRKAQGRFRPDESERLLRVSRISERAIELFDGDVKTAREWLDSPKPALNGRTPFRLTKTEIGAREVESLISRLVHGVFS